MPKTRVSFSPSKRPFGPCHRRPCSAFASHLFQGAYQYPKIYLSNDQCKQIPSLASSRSFGSVGFPFEDTIAIFSFGPVLIPRLLGYPKFVVSCCQERVNLGCMMTGRSLPYLNQSNLEPRKRYTLVRIKLIQSVGKKKDVLAQQPISQRRGRPNVA